MKKSTNIKQTTTLKFSFTEDEVANILIQHVKAQTQNKDDKYDVDFDISSSGLFRSATVVCVNIKETVA